MSCDLLNNYQIDCRTGVGGVKSVYILGSAGAEVTGTTVNATEEIDTISGTGVFYTIEQVKQTSSLTENGVFDEAAGVVYYTQDVILKFNKISAEARNMVKVLAQNPNLTIVVKDNTDVEYFITNATMTASIGATGASFGDSNSFTITLQGISFSEPMKLLAGGGLGSADVTLTGITVD